MWPRRFARARSIGIGVGALGAAAFARKRMLRWGATGSELNLVLPGDDLLPRANLIATRSVTITSPPSEVWPWIAQLGQGRGGFYTYDRLENLVGAEIHNAGTIMPECQHPEVGDEIRLAPEVSLSIAQVDPDRALVLRGGIPMGKVQALYDFTWAFVISDVPNQSSRLLVRERYAYSRMWAALIVEPTEVISFLMTQRMLRGIKERAEGMINAALIPDAAPESA